MIDAGIFDGQRFELLDGDLIDKSGQLPPHSYSVRLVAEWLISIFGPRRVQVQLPVDLQGEDRDTSIPEPDVAVLIERKVEYQKRDPRADELLLIVEVANTTRDSDLGPKAALYAKAAVREYWVLDVSRRLLTVHRQPAGELYRQIHIYGAEDLVSIEGRAEQVRVADLLSDPQ